MPPKSYFFPAVLKLAYLAYLLIRKCLKKKRRVQQEYEVQRTQTVSVSTVLASQLGDSKSVFQESKDEIEEEDQPQVKQSMEIIDLGNINEEDDKPPKVEEDKEEATKEWQDSVKPSITKNVRRRKKKLFKF